MSIINFLLYWSGRVYEWFGWLYESGRRAALYAWTWAQEAGLRYYQIGTIYTQNKINDLTNTVWSWIVARYDAAINYSISIRDYLLSVFNSIYGWVDSRLVSLQNWWDATTNSIYAWAEGKINQLSVWVFTEVNKVRDWLMGYIQPYIDYFENLFQILERNFEAKYGWIIKPNSSGESTLFTFLNNPMGFLMAYIWSVFVDLTCYGLAYGFGTVKYDLPPLPDWSSPGISGGAILPSKGVPGETGLLSPLKSISVSGYTFGSSHKGIDLGLENGDPVYAMHDGEVLLTSFSGSGYGNQVIISGGAWWSRYAHLATINVVTGQQIRAGTGLGTGNSTGNSTGPHLHLEIKHNGAYIDPVTVL